MLDSSLYLKELAGEVVEIGSFQGKSTIWLAQENPKVIAIDPHEGKTDDEQLRPTLIAFKKHIKQAGVEKKVNVLVARSQDVVATWESPIKLLFIDGLHEYKPVLSDYKSWSPYLANGGIIALHDAFCGWPGVASVILEKALKDDLYREAGVVGSIIYLIKGKRTLVDRINWWRCSNLIKFSLWLHRVESLPKRLKFFLIHRVNKLLLLNRFTIRYLF